MEKWCAMEIIHDRAVEFLPDVLQDTASIMGLTQLPTSSGHPQTDKLVEQLNKTLKAILSEVVSKGGKDWDECLGPTLWLIKQLHKHPLDNPHFS